MENKFFVGKQFILRAKSSNFPDTLADFGGLPVTISSIEGQNLVVSHEFAPNCFEKFSLCVDDYEKIWNIEEISCAKRSN